MKINALTVCVNYSDYLAWSLPSAKNLFDKLVVVTSHDDKETQNVCKFYYVECITTDIMYENGAKFNKGKAISLGLDYLNSDDYIALFDSDIVFPPRFAEFIRSRNYDRNCIYGIDRLDVKSWDEWIHFLCNPVSQHWVGSTWSAFPVMYRVTQGLNYSPIGYFSMWHSSSKHYKGGYPTNSDNAAESDLSFALNWPAEKRILIPEVYLYHLSSEKGEIGQNWNGRKSERFGPK